MWHLWYKRVRDNFLSDAKCFPSRPPSRPATRPNGQRPPLRKFERWDWDSRGWHSSPVEQEAHVVHTKLTKLRLRPPAWLAWRPKVLIHGGIANSVGALKLSTMRKDVSFHHNTSIASTSISILFDSQIHFIFISTIVLDLHGPSWIFRPWPFRK